MDDLMREYGVTDEDFADIKPELTTEKGEEIYIYDTDKSVTFGGFAVTKIAADWMKEHDYQTGEELATYKKVANDIKTICNNNPKALYWAMPDCGLQDKLRWKICKQVCLHTSAKREYDFYKFLERGMLIKTKHNTKDFDDADDGTEDDATISALATLKTSIPGLRVWVNSVPAFLKQPMYKSFWPVAAMYFHRDFATHLDGEPRWPVFEVVNIGEYSSRKGDIIRYAKNFLDRIFAEDRVNAEIERNWENELKSKSSNKDKPADPEVVKRIMDDATAKQQMRRMERAQGASILEIQPEISDAVNQKGAGSNSKETQYLKTFDRDDVANDTMTHDSWRGRCRMYLNVLLCGQWHNVKKFFKDVTNGTVSRFLWSVIPDTSKCGNLYNKKLTDDEKKELEAIKTYGWNMTYGEEREDGTHIVNSEPICLDKEVSWILKHIEAWQDAKMIEGIKENNDAKCKMRFRRGDYILRMAMVAVRCYQAVYGEKLALWMKNDIRKTLFAIANDDLDVICAFWGDTSGAQKYKTAKFANLYDMIDAEFTIGDLEVQKSKCGYFGRTRDIVHAWKKAGLITKINTCKWKKN